jgi:glucosamine--fructose-6-phosphate aminotransferase (isomerizing)
MCGLYGIAGYLPKSKRHAVVSALAVLNSSRGTDSTGLGILTADGRHEIVKQALASPEFILKKHFIEAMKIPAITVLGHCRWATHGSVQSSNAHPFRCASVVGTHNGMVSNVNHLRAWSGREFEVDSQYLVWALAHYGHLGPAEGSLTMAYFNLKDPNSILTLFRHNRPLAYAITADGRGVIYSSEMNHLVTACAIAGLEIEKYCEMKNFSQAVFNTGTKGKILVNVKLAQKEKQLF